MERWSGGRGEERANSCRASACSLVSLRTATLQNQRSARRVEWKRRRVTEGRRDTRCKPACTLALRALKRGARQVKGKGKRKKVRRKDGGEGERESRKRKEGGTWCKTACSLASLRTLMLRLPTKTGERKSIREEKEGEGEKESRRREEGEREISVARRLVHWSSCVPWRWGCPLRRRARQVKGGGW